MDNELENSWTRKSKRYRLGSLAALGELYGRNTGSRLDDSQVGHDGTIERQSLASDKLSKLGGDL